MPVVLTGGKKLVVNRHRNKLREMGSHWVRPLTLVCPLTLAVCACVYDLCLRNLLSHGNAVMQLHVYTGPIMHLYWWPLSGSVVGQ